MVAVAPRGDEQLQPLARLFAIALRSLVDDLHEQLVATGLDRRPACVRLRPPGSPRSPDHGHGARDADGHDEAGDLEADRLDDRSGVRRTPAAGEDGRKRPVQITDAGKELLSEVEGIYEDLESGWAKIIGGDAVEALRGDLTAVLQTRHGGRLPVVRPTTS